MIISSLRTFVCFGVFAGCLGLVACDDDTNPTLSPADGGGDSAAQDAGRPADAATGTDSSVGVDSGTDATTDATVDATVDAADASTDSPTDSPVVDAADAPCNSIVNGATVVAKTAMNVAQPAMTGGTILDGTYYKTAIINYATSTPGTTTHKETLVFSGAGTVLNSVSTKNSDPEARFTANVVTATNAIAMGLTCPTVATVNGTYTATASEFKLVTQANEVHVYTKQ